MKKRILFLLLCFLYTASFGQNNCENEISTDPNNPTNTTLPNTNLQGTPVSNDARFLNGFDWWQAVDIPITGMQIPGPTMNFLTTPSQDIYYNYIYNDEEMTVESGWELMLYNTGYMPDQSSSPSVQTPDIPFIVLYNRFTGILRIFAAYGDGKLASGGTTFDGVIVRVRFDQETEINGIFRLRDGSDEALDQNTLNLMTQGNALHQNSPKDWFSTDLQLAYDPCSCYYPANLKFEFEFLESMDLQLLGRSISVTDNIADGNSLLTDNNFLTNYSFDGENADDQIVMYKVMKDFVDDYIERMEKYQTDLAAVNEFNKKVERNIVIAKVFKWAILSTGGLSIPALTAGGLISGVTTWAAELILPDNATDEAISEMKDKIKKEASKILGQQADTFIKKNFEKKEKPDKPEPPTASFTEMTMQGTITNSTTIAGPRFYTPGTYGSIGTGSPQIVDQNEYPIYNNLIGHFALLNTPKIKAYKSPRSIVDHYAQVYQDINGFDKYRVYDSWNGNYQFQLENDIYYAINDIGVVSHEVRVAFEIVTETKKDATINANLFTDPSGFSNLQSLNVETDEYYQIQVFNGKGFNNGSNYCSQPFFNSSTCTYAALNLPQQVYQKNSLTFTSPYLPIDAVSPAVMSFGYINDTYWGIATDQNYLNPETRGWDFGKFKVKMKVIVDVVFEDLDENGDNVTGTYMFTYDVDDINWQSTALITNIPNSPVNYNSFEENLVLGTTVFDGSPVNGCKLVGNQYTCHGWDNVVVNGDLTTANGYLVDIIGGNEVLVINESNISPEIVLYIESLLDLTDPMPLADAEFVQNFCRNELGEGFPSYQANSLPKGLLEQIQQEQAATANDQSELSPILDLTLFPVPAKDVLNMKTTIDLTNAQITFFDLSGRQIDLEVKNFSGRLFQVNTGSLATGLYRVVIAGEEGRVTKSFTVTKY